MKQNIRSQSLFEKAKQFIPGGVNSPVRAFRAVGGNPLFIKRAKGAYLYDEDGNEYIDLINSWGPMILGHANAAVEEAVIEALSCSPSFGAPTAREVDMAELICSMIPSVEKVRMVNSGTEATMSAIRVARGYTGRDKIIKMEGCYHGHGDSFLIAAGSGVMTFGTPDSPGVTKGTAQDTLTAPFNDLDAVSRLIQKNPKDIAAVILEPVVGNMGCVPPQPGYLQGLRDLCTKHGILLILDEVMTGFRLAPGGRSGALHVKAGPYHVRKDYWRRIASRRVWGQEGDHGLRIARGAHLSGRYIVWKSHGNGCRTDAVETSEKQSFHLPGP